MSRKTKRRISTVCEATLIAMLVISGVTLPPRPAYADSYDFEVLVIGGGGGGGASQDSEGAGGGGAGAYRETTLSMAEGLHAITVGSGGSGGTAGGAGTDGGDSAISTLLTAEGGGGGGGTSSTAGHNGGSGGGGSAHTAGGGSGGSGTAGQGNDGGTGGNSGQGGGGGGGASAVGTAGDGTDGGDGGSGTASTISGSSVTYAGGGGGGGASGISGGGGGSGGGGDGGDGPSGDGSNGTVNTGSGGGGGAGSAGDGGNGGSGIVIIRYLTTDVSVATGGTITTDGAYTVHTFTSGGTFSFALAEAVDPPLQGMSDTLSVSAPASASNHTIVFTVPGGVPAGGSFSIDFEGTGGAVFATGSVDFTDIDVASTGGELTLAGCGGQSALTWGVCISGSQIHFQSATSALDAGTQVTVEIGTNATFQHTGDQQLINPSATSGTEISFDTFDLTDASIGSGVTFVAIVEQVTLSATIADTFTFEIQACDTTSCAIDGDTVDVTSTATLANFGNLVDGTPVTMGSSLSVTSNAINGFVVTVEQNHNMLASNGADIDSFQDGTPTTGAAWASPAATNGLENTYGHLGLYTEDGSGTDYTGTASASSAGNDGDWFGLDGTNAFEVWDHDSVADGMSQDSGHIDVGYRIEISGLQEAGVYTNQLMYIATPTF